MSEEPEDQQLLAEFVRANAEAAFAALVQRHLGLVYSTALRCTRNPDHAEEIAQAVFIILARKAKDLSPRVVLSGWLYQTARLTAANFIKGEFRRQRREQEAYMQSTLREPEPETWTHIAPLLDEAMGTLGETDRTAVVLRYFENRTAAEIGVTLRLTEETARKRVNRALEKLRKYFTRRGHTFSATAIAGAMAAHSVSAAPVGLAHTISTLAVTQGAAAGGSTLALVQGALKIMAWTQAKTAIVASVAILLTVGTTTLVLHHHPANNLPAPQPVAAGQTEFPRDTWRFAGYSNPESAFMSVIWAVSRYDESAARAGMSAAALAVPNASVIGTKDRQDFRRITAYRIVDQERLSADEVSYTVFADGLGQSNKFVLQHIGNEWKLGPKHKQ